MMLDPIYVFYVICEAIAAFVGLIFNGYILFVLLCSTVSTNNVLLLLMALADTTICLVILICNTPMSLTQRVPVLGVDLDVSSIPSQSHQSYDQIICKFQGSVWTVLPLCMLWTICGLILDRYIAIIKPLRYSRLINVRKTAISLISIWIMLILFAFPPLAGCCQYKFSSSHSGCIVMCSRIKINMFELFYITLYLISVLLPVVIICVCNIHILIIARNHRHRIVSAIYEITIRAQATVTHQTNHASNYLKKYKGRDAFFTIFQLVGSLIFLTLPYFIIYAYKVFSNQMFDDYWTSSATLLFTLTPLVNGYVYGVKSKALRKTFKRLLQRYLFEQQASIEIDRRLSLRSQSSFRDGWNSLISTSTFSSNMLYRSQRRNSAPFSLTFSNGPLVKESDTKFSNRRQSLENFSDTELNASFDNYDFFHGLLKKPSFSTESNANKQKIALSPIQELSYVGNSENSSLAINYD